MPEQPRSRLLDSVRRSITPKRYARSESKSILMYSTAQECQPSPDTSFRDLPSTTARPTIEQIAMGLHVSRTPHLRQHARSPSYSTPPPSLPRRSSGKRPSFASSNTSSSALHPLPMPTDASASTTTVTTSASLHVTGSTMSESASASPRLTQQHQSNSALSALKSRVARLLPGERKRSTSAPSSRVLVDSTASSSETLSGSTRRKKAAARKAVRFEDS